MGARNLSPEGDSEREFGTKSNARLLSVKELYTRSYAIVIGISCYKEEKLNLKNPVNDAREVARVLKEKHGFDDVQLILYSDATRENLAHFFDDKIRSREITKDDRLLVYFSGHGHIREGKNQQGHPFTESFLLPYDAEFRSDHKYSSYIELEKITRNCKLCSAKHVLIILDSCYSGTALIDGRAPPRPDIINDEYLKLIINKRSIQALAATDKSQLALDSGVGFNQLSSAHGAFTGCLLEVLDGDFDPDKDGILTASELGQYLVKNVPRNEIPQNPLYGYLPGSEIGDFIFNIYPRPVAENGSTNPVLPAPPNPSVDEMSPLAKAASDYYARRDYERAIIFYDRILEINPKHIVSLTRKGISCMKLRRIEDAKNCFNQVISIENDNVEALDYIERLNQLAETSDEVPEKGSSLKKETSDPKFSSFCEQGLRSFQQGDYSAAARYYGHAIKLNPENDDAWNYKGIALHEFGKYNQAIKCYENALELNPKYDDAWNYKGLALYDLHKYNQAIKCYDKALELNPENDRTLHYKDLALNKLNEYN
ncbi:MAG: tetratricopeptide repeat protein [Nitrososphaera sp.]|jgi:tetratricopeptide (TPR) repeat protein